LSKNEFSYFYLREPKRLTITILIRLERAPTREKTKVATTGYKKAPERNQGLFGLDFGESGLFSSSGTHTLNLAI